MQSLKLSGNRLADESLPASALSALTNLTALLLDGNRLTVLPEALSSLTSLLRLDVAHNQLQALPQAIGGCSALRELNVARNQLTELPASLGKDASQVTSALLVY